jgi:flavoprotein
MGQKTSTPIYIMPTDFREGIVTTKLPNGENLDINITKQDAYHVRNLESMRNTFVFENPDEILSIFEKHSHSED